MLGKSFVTEVQLYLSPIFLIFLQKNPSHCDGG